MTTSDLQQLTQLLAQQLQGPKSLERVLLQRMDRHLDQLENKLTAQLERILSQQLADLLPAHLQILAPELGRFLIPHFADGGILSGDAPVVLAAEAGPEAVLPLRRGADGQLGVAVMADEPDAALTPPANPPQEVHLHIHHHSPPASVLNLAEADESAIDRPQTGADEAVYQPAFPPDVPAFEQVQLSDGQLASLSEEMQMMVRQTIATYLAEEGYHS